MTRICTVCSSPAVDAINQQLLSGATYTMIANTFRVSWQAARYHVLNHIPPLLAQAKQAEDVAKASDLLSMATMRDAKALALMAKAEGTGDIKTAGQMLRVSLVSLELLARLRGELDERAVVNVLLAPEWLATRAALLAALEPYIEAKIAVSTALLALEEGASNGHG
jgi:hypothetical protein